MKSGCDRLRRTEEPGRRLYIIHLFSRSRETSQQVSASSLTLGWEEAAHRSIEFQDSTLGQDKILSLREVFNWLHVSRHGSRAAKAQHYTSLRSIKISVSQRDDRVMEYDPTSSQSNITHSTLMVLRSWTTRLNPPAPCLSLRYRRRIKAIVLVGDKALRTHKLYQYM